MHRALPPVIALLLVALPAAAAAVHLDADGASLGIPAEGTPTGPASPGASTHGGMDGTEPLNKVAGATLYPYYPLLVLELQRLATSHPDLVRLHSAGKSVLGLDLWVLEIADFGNPDRIPLAEREVIYLDGGTHSNEYSAVYFVTEWAQFLLDEFEANETARWIVENRHTWILPMVNPDGSHAFGRLNAMGVNINRNFPGTWGAISEIPVDNNPGPYPNSEPETQAVTALMDAIRPDYVNSIHCCGNLWLHPYGAEHLALAADFDMFNRTCNEVFAEVRRACGPVWSTIYPASGTTVDEGYVRVGASSWTYEMSGRGRVVGPWAEPVTFNEVREQEIESWEGVMHAFLHAEKYGALPRVVDVRGDKQTLHVTVANEGWGNVSHATLCIAGACAALPAIEPDEAAVVRLDGAFRAGSVPLTLEYKKRLHPESNWGLQRDTLALQADGAHLVLGDIEDLDAGDTGRVLTAPWLPLLAVALVALTFGRRR